MSDAALTGFGTAAFLFIVMTVGWISGKIVSGKEADKRVAAALEIAKEWKTIAAMHEAAARLRGASDDRVVAETGRTVAHAVESIQRTALEGGASSGIPPEDEPAL